MYLSLLGNINQYSKRKLPIPVKEIKSHQPDLPISCNLLTLTDKPGKKVKKNRNRENDPYSWWEKKILSNLKANNANNNSNNLQYQYSERTATPEKMVYLEKQELIAWKKVIY